MSLGHRPAKVSMPRRNILKSSSLEQTPTVLLLPTTFPDVLPPQFSSSTSEDVPSSIPTTRSRSSSISSTLSDLHYSPKEEKFLLQSIQINSSESKHKLSYHGRDIPAHWVPPLNPLSKKVYASMDRSLYQEPEIQVKTWQERVREYDDICKEKEKMESEKGVKKRKGEEEKVKVSSVLELRRRILGNKESEEVRKSPTITAGSVRLGEILCPSPPDSSVAASPRARSGTSDYDLQESSTQDLEAIAGTLAPAKVRPSTQKPDPTILAFSVTLHLSYTTTSSPSCSAAIYHIISTTINIPTKLNRLTLRDIQHRLYNLLLPNQNPASLRAHFLRELGSEADVADWWSEPSLHVGFGAQMCEETIVNDGQLRNALGNVLGAEGKGCYIRAEWRKSDSV